MNLIEQFIEEVESEKMVPAEVLKRYDISEPMIRVVVHTNSYGKKKVEDRIFFLDEWEKAKRKGYFMG